MARYRVTIVGSDYDAMADLVRSHRVAVQRNTVRRSRTGQFSVEAVVDDSRIPDLEQAGYQVQRHEDLDANGRLRQVEVGQGNRYRAT